jgi:(2Fe-2S) ferredoxin
VPNFFPTRAHLLVCTGTDCAARGGRELFARSTAALERDGLAYYKTGGGVRLTESGCLGACAHGPTVAAYHDRGDGSLAQAWYAGMDETKVLELARALDGRRDPPAEGRFDRSRPVG